MMQKIRITCSQPTTRSSAQKILGPLRYGKDFRTFPVNTQDAVCTIVLLHSHKQCPRLCGA